MKQQIPRRRIDVNVEELDWIIDGAKGAPLSESDSEKLKTALHALAERLLPRSKTEKTDSVFEDLKRAGKEQGGRQTDPPPGHGRNGADAYRERTGVFTSGIVSIGFGRKIALYFTGRQHAGEKLADVLKQRAAGLSAPIQMCDALSRNTPKLSPGVEILLANCLAHGRRQFVEVAQNFPEPCRYVLESLGSVYANDAAAREQKLSVQDRLQFHQQHSGR